MYGQSVADHNLFGTEHSGRIGVAPQKIPRRGSTLGPNKRIASWRRRCDDESGAEMVEFAIVVVLLVVLVYGIVSLGLILAAKETVTQAASDGARAGIVYQTIATGEAAAVNQASADLDWMGTGTSTAATCASDLTIPSTCSSSCGPTSSSMTCAATEAPCVSDSNNTCLTVTVTYNYANDPLFPPLPGLGILSPNTIASVAVLQVSAPTQNL